MTPSRARTVVWISPCRPLYVREGNTIRRALGSRAFRTAAACPGARSRAGVRRGAVRGRGGYRRRGIFTQAWDATPWPCTPLRSPRSAFSPSVAVGSHRSRDRAVVALVRRLGGLMCDRASQLRANTEAAKWYLKDWAPRGPRHTFKPDPPTASGTREECSLCARWPARVVGMVGVRRQRL